MYQRRLIVAIIFFFSVITASAGFLTGSYGKLMSGGKQVDLYGVSFSLFDGSDGAPTSSYGNGHIEIKIDPEEHNSLIIIYYSSNGKHIKEKYISREAEYGFEEEEVKEPLLRAKDIYVFIDSSSKTRRKAFQVSKLCMAPESKPFVPHTIYIQYFVNGSLKISATMEYSEAAWDDLEKVLKKFQNYLY
ncbi:MAG: hypothetical protein NC187_03260 [Candidatus Amulumruptor caecigallinarius]|nr:hypothetical protein [Candidatus Amulumruptor caecigallinarius]MCM1396494.1 hypothetical protein [Candidatus Amulumruptor caecigallinarius]MCM1453449.1 hypothetical protein [bacterium]